MSKAEAEVRSSQLAQLRQATRALLGHRELRVLLACALVNGLAGSFVMPYFSLFATREVGMSVPAFGAFMTATAVANLLISTFWSRRSDQLHSRLPVLLIASAAGALGYVGYAFVRNPWLLLAIGTLVLGVASLSFSQLFAHAREALVRSRVSAHDAALHMNTFRMSYALAWTFGPALAAVVLDALAFRGLFLAAAGFQLTFLALAWRSRAGASVAGEALAVATLSKSQVPTQHSAAPPASSTSERSWASPEILRWLAAFVLIFAAQSISMSNMSLFVLGELGGSETDVGVIFSLAPVFELPFMLYFGLLATRLEPGRIIGGAFGLAIAYYGGLALVQAPWQVFPLQILSAAIVAITSGVAITFFQDKLPHQLGAATNLYVNTIRIGSTSGYLLFGAVAGEFGYRGAYVACTLASCAAWGISRMQGHGPAPPKPAGG